MKAHYSYSSISWISIRSTNFAIGHHLVIKCVSSDLMLLFHNSLAHLRYLFNFYLALFSNSDQFFSQKQQSLQKQALCSLQWLFAVISAIHIMQCAYLTLQPLKSSSLLRNIDHKMSLSIVTTSMR